MFMQFLYIAKTFTIFLRKSNILALHTFFSFFFFFYCLLKETRISIYSEICFLRKLLYMKLFKGICKIDYIEHI